MLVWRKTLLLPWSSEEFLPGGSTRRFFQKFSRGQKWWYLFFPTRN